MKQDESAEGAEGAVGNPFGNFLAFLEGLDPKAFSGAGGGFAALSQPATSVFPQESAAFPGLFGLDSQGPEGRGTASSGPPDVGQVYNAMQSAKPGINPIIGMPLQATGVPGWSTSLNQPQADSGAPSGQGIGPGAPSGNYYSGQPQPGAPLNEWNTLAAKFPQFQFTPVNHDPFAGQGGTTSVATSTHLGR